MRVAAVVKSLPALGAMGDMTRVASGTETCILRPRLQGEPRHGCVSAVTGLFTFTFTGRVRRLLETAGS